MGKLKYYLSAITAYIIWGMFSLVLRPLKAFAPLDILFYRVFCCLALALVIIVLFRRKSLLENRQHFLSLERGSRLALLGWNVLAGLLLVTNWFLFIYVMNFVSVKATALAYLVCPILTALLAFLWLKEPMKKLQWVALALGVIGLAILSFGHFYDLLLSVLVAISYATYLILQKKNKGFDMFFVLTLHICIAVAVLAPLYPVLSGPVPVEPTFYEHILLIAVGFTLIPMLLNLFALRGIKSGSVGMLMNINPIIAFTLSLVYFKEDADVWQIAAYGIIFFSVLVFNLPAMLGKRG